MEKVTLLLCVENAEYGKKFLHFLIDRKNPNLLPELVTGAGLLDERIRMEEKRVIILTDNKEIKEDEQKEVFYLSHRENKEQKEIFQFQKAEGIYHDLLEHIGMESEFSVQSEKEGNKGVFCIFSPIGGGGTAAAVHFTQYLGKRGSCLYLNLSEFPLFYDESLKTEPDVGNKGLGDLFFILEEKEFVEKQRRLKSSFGTADILPPMAHFKDLFDCSGKDWKLFLHRLLYECGYDSIVMEMDRLYEFSLELMETCKRIFWIQTPDIGGQIRRSVFRRYCRMERKEEIDKKMEILETGGILNSWQKNLENKQICQIAQDDYHMAAVQNIMLQKEKGGVDKFCGRSERADKEKSTRRGVGEDTRRRRNR